MLRVTVDTNILISALIFPGGKPFQFLGLAREGNINLTVSSAILDEMGAHADYIMQLIRSEPGLQKLLKQQTADVACLGGGPGSDLLGILKYMMQAGPSDTCLTVLHFRQRTGVG